MVGTKTMTKFLGEGTVRDYERLTALFKDRRFLAYKTRMIDTEAKVMIAAAKNRQLFADLDRCCRASKPTFSRRKTFLQKLGIIEEEKVKTEYGRPPLRLKLNKKRFEEVYGVKIS